MATSFSFSPGLCVTKLINFASYDPVVSIPEGDYKFELYAVVDGKKGSKPKMIFDINIDTDTVNCIGRGDIKVDLRHYKF